MDALVELEKEEKKQFDRSGGFEDELTEAEAESSHSFIQSIVLHLKIYH